MATTKREDWLDILRAFAIFCVILGHTYRGYYLHLLVNPVKMPIFFFISGYLIWGGKYSLKTTVLKRLRQLFIPMIVFKLVPVRIIYYIFLGDFQLLWTYIQDYLLGTSCWFVYSFFLSAILFQLLINFTKNNLPVMGIIAGICFILGILLKDNSYFDIWCINTSLTSLIYMYFGYIYREGVLKKFDCPLIAGGCAVVYGILIGVSIIFWPHKTINFHTCNYYNILICLPLSFCGILALKKLTVFLTGKYHSVIWKALSSFGKNTFVVYLTATNISVLFLKVINKFFGFASDGFLICLASTFLSCAISWFISIICKKYFPFLVGEKSHRRKKQA